MDDAVPPLLIRDVIDEVAARSSLQRGSERPDALSWPAGGESVYLSEHLTVCLPGAVDTVSGFRRAVWGVRPRR